MTNPMQSDQQPQGLQVEPLSHERLARAKAAYTTRHVAWLARTRRANDPAPVSLLRGDRAPRSGDVVLARVDTLGQHKHIELIDGRRIEAGNRLVLQREQRPRSTRLEPIPGGPAGTTGSQSG